MSIQVTYGSSLVRRTFYNDVLRVLSRALKTSSERYFQMGHDSFLQNSIHYHPRISWDIKSTIAAVNICMHHHSLIYIYVHYISHISRPSISLRVLKSNNASGYGFGSVDTNIVRFRRETEKLNFAVSCMNRLFLPPRQTGGPMTIFSHQPW
jgi:hypothetical protein